MGRRRDNGRWTLPGGHLNEGEHHHDGAIRELKEEAGIETDLLEHLGTHDVLTFTGKPMKIHAYKLEGKHATSVKNDPDKEVERWQWIDITNGLPKEILNSLHSPKNVVLQCLGLQPKDQEEPYMARVRDKLKMLKKHLTKTDIEDPEDRHKETTYTHTHLGHSFAEVKHPNTPEDHKAYEVKSPKGKKDIYFARNPEEVGKKIAMQSRLTGIKKSLEILKSVPRGTSRGVK
jgi:ADP-ribose pyrophosphatase YjhB (NUDIX family)